MSKRKLNLLENGTSTLRADLLGRMPTISGPASAPLFIRGAPGKRIGVTTG